MLFLDFFLKTFSLKNEGFGALKNRKFSYFLEILGKTLELSDFSLLRLNLSIFPYRSYRTLIANHFDKKGWIYLPVQKESLSCGR